MAQKLEISAFGYSEIGPKDENKDSYNYAIPRDDSIDYKGAVAVIADGVSSSDGGGEAARTSTKTFIEDYYSTSDTWSVKKSAQKVLSALNRWLYRNGQSEISVMKGWVTTFSTVIFKSNTAHVIHVGDSRIYRCREGSLEQLTRDHSVQYGADRTYLARALGIDVSLDVDYQSYTLEKNDVFMLSSDGVHDFLSRAVIQACLSSEETPENMSKQLVKKAFENQSDDNVTALVVKIENLPIETEDEAYQKLTQLPFPPDLEPGYVIDGFKILQVLSESPRGQVYLVEDVAANSQAAVLKTPSVNYEDDPGYLNGFVQEEWIGKRINHPGLLRTYDSGRKKNFLYYTSEYVDGYNLRQWMHDHPQPKLAEVRPIVDQLTQALRALHRQDIIHQDLKPENIMIDRNQRVKIIDFGSTKVAGISEIESVMNQKYPMGTLNYTAPEYLMHDKGSNRSDIYSLGVITYEMLVGDLPYKELNNFNLKSYHQLKYRSITTFRNDIPDWLDITLQKAVAANPLNRHTLLSEFHYDFTTPREDIKTKHGKKPLLQRNPILFWQGLSGVLFLICMILMIKCFGN